MSIIYLSGSLFNSSGCLALWAIPPECVFSESCSEWIHTWWDFFFPENYISGPQKVLPICRLHPPFIQILMVRSNVSKCWFIKESRMYIFNIRVCYYFGYVQKLVGANCKCHEKHVLYLLVNLMWFSAF